MKGLYATFGAGCLAAVLALCSTANAVTVTVQSQNPASGATIYAIPADSNGTSSGATTFTLSYPAGATFQLLATIDLPGGKTFEKWLKNGNNYAVIPGITVTAAADTYTAVYASLATMTVNSQNPASGVDISVSPGDWDWNDNGTTPFTRRYEVGGPQVILTAPDSAGGHAFSKWLKDGSDFSANKAITVPVGTNTYTAVYGGAVPPPTPTVSGHVLDQLGGAMSGVRMDFGAQGAVNTDGNGLYTKTVPNNWSGRATPSKAGWTFTPPHKDYANLTADQDDEDYTGAPVVAPEPAIGMSTGTLTPSCQAGSDAAGQSFDVWNSGPAGTTLNYTVSDDAAWLSCTPTSGASTGEHDAIGVTYNSDQLTVGPHTATITVADPNATNTPQTIHVTLTVSAAPPATISGHILDQTSTAIAGVTVDFGAQGSVATDATGLYTKTVPNGWSGRVTPSKSGWTFTPPYRDYSNLTSDQESEDYSGTSTVTPEAAIALSAGTLAPSCQAGSDAAAQSFQVWNSGDAGTTLNYTISDDAPWLSCTPTSGTSTGEHDAIGITYNTDQLAEGTYDATITVSDPNAGNDPQTIAVTLTVSAAAPPTLVAPTSLKLRVKDSSHIYLTWKDTSTGEDGYCVQVLKPGKKTWEDVRYYGPNAAKSASIGIQKGTTRFRVCAFTGDADDPNRVDGPVSATVYRRR